MNRWYSGKCREEWSLRRKTVYYVIRMWCGLWDTPIPFLLLMLLLGGAVSAILIKYEVSDRQKHLSPRVEAEAWVNQANVKAVNIFCTGTEEYVGNAEDAQCVVTTDEKKVITLACANVWVQKTGCRIEHLEK